MFRKIVIDAVNQQNKQELLLKGPLIDKTANNLGWLAKSEIIFGDGFDGVTDI
jgi:hypothetical protein